MLVLQQFRPADEVAHYFAASKTLTLVTFVYFAIAASAAHRFAAYHVAGDREGLASFVAVTIRWMFWPSLAAMVLILALGKPMLWLFGPGFVDAYPVMFVLAIGLLARAAIGPAERLLTMVGQQRICALAYACAFAVNLTGCIVLAKPYGGIGVAIATSSAFVVELALLFLIAQAQGWPAPVRLEAESIIPKVGTGFRTRLCSTQKLGANSPHQRADERAHLVSRVPQRRRLLDPALEPAAPDRAATPPARRAMSPRRRGRTA